VDILINNAGILSNNKSQATTPEEWRNVMAINLGGMFYLARAVIPGMKAKGRGRIVDVSSQAAPKGGVISLIRSPALETAPFGITVNAIAPAYVKTPMISEQLTEEERQGVLKKIPVGRFCEPEEFAHVVLFLVSPLAGFITGDLINLNGGLYFN
jgi:3-oxoacyl-[acyl-carrier protein] reductase